MWRPQIGLVSGKLAIKAQHRRRNKGFFCQKAGIVEQKPGVKIIRAVGDDIVTRQQSHDVVRPQAHLVGNQRHIRVQRGNTVLGAVYLGPADVGRAVGDLPLQVGERDNIIVHQANGANTGGGKVHQ